MNKKKIIRRVLILSAWFLVVCGLGILLVSANRKQKDHLCRKVVIVLKAASENDYIEKEDVQKQLERSASGSLVRRPVSSVDLGKLERGLESNAWIGDAELYFDSRDVLHVSVEVREPIARVFTTEGISFYIDSSGHRMPLLEKISIRVPVVTGFTGAGRMNRQDSALLNGVKQVSGYIYRHPFWNAQIGEIDITTEKKFELIPVIGDQVIKLGDASDIEAKLNRLYVFYRQVMSKVGFNKYAALDVEFDGQVVALNKGPVSAVDSLQLKKNIEELVNRASLQNVEEEMLPSQNAVPVKNNSADSTTAAQTNSVSTKTNPNPGNQTRSLEGNKMEKRPKAVMKKRDGG